MPRRLLIVVAAVALIGLAGTGSAQAKGPDQATVSGPGIGTTQLTMDDPDRTLDAMLRVTHFWDGTGPTDWAADPPPGDLGVAFAVTYHVPDLHDPGGAKPESIRQELYPFAASGPVVHLPPGQTLFDTPLTAGWIAASDQLVDLLTELGATRSATDGTTPVADVTSADSNDSGQPWVLPAVGAGVLALGALTLAHLRRRARA